MKNIAIFGAGGFGREVLTLINDINKVDPIWNIIGFYDDNLTKGTLINGFPVLGGMKELNEENNSLSLAISIGSPQAKLQILKKIINPKILFPTLIHPSVLIGDINTVSIGKGCIICAASIITTNISIGDFVIINLACTIGHDVTIKNCAAFMPSCNISGEVMIDENVYCGAGVIIINRTSIGKNTIVGAGAVVVKPLPENCTAVGMPAKPISFH